MLRRTSTLTLGSEHLLQLGERAFHASRSLLDHYQTLGIQYNASKQEIRDACWVRRLPVLCFVSFRFVVSSLVPRETGAALVFRFLKKAKVHHPDANPDDESAVARFQEIADAHTTLTDDTEKRVYDSSIGNVAQRLRPNGPQSASRRSSPKAPGPMPGGGVGIDQEAWNAWHYGDETNGGYSRESTFQTNKTRDKNKTKTNKWFERKTRSAEERQEAANLNAVREEKNNVVNRLHLRREARRNGQAQPEARAPDAGDRAACAIS